MLLARKYDFADAGRSCSLNNRPILRRWVRKTTLGAAGIVAEPQFSTNTGIYELQAIAPEELASGQFVTIQYRAASLALKLKRD